MLDFFARTSENQPDPETVMTCSLSTRPHSSSHLFLWLAFFGIFGMPTRTRAQSWELVHIIPMGQFYHRPEHIVVPGARAILPGFAVKKGYYPCPECMPPEFTEDGRLLWDPGQTPYYDQYLEERDPLFVNYTIKARLEALDLDPRDFPAPRFPLPEPATSGSRGIPLLRMLP